MPYSGKEGKGRGGGNQVEWSFLATEKEKDGKAWSSKVCLFFLSDRVLCHLQCVKN